MKLPKIVSDYKEELESLGVDWQEYLDLIPLAVCDKVIYLAYLLNTGSSHWQTFLTSEVIKNASNPDYWTDISKKLKG